MIHTPLVVLLLALAGLPQTRPQNVLLIVADDLGTDRVAAYDEHPQAGPTPVLDGLAANGVLFRRAYSDPVCSPTRTTILTGRYGAETGMGSAGPWDNPDSPNGQWMPVGPLLPELLDGGPATALVGKWHLDTIQDDNPGGAGWDAPIDRGWDYYAGHPQGEFQQGHSYYDYLRVVADEGGYTTATCTTYATTQEVDDALAWIDSRRGSQPWFLMLAFHAPHAPFEAPPANLHTFPDLTGAPVATVYRAMVEAMDAEIGRLLTGIRPAVLANTTVIFLGDNGTPPEPVTAPSLSDKAKGKLYDGGCRVPLIVFGKAVTDPGREVSALVNTTDLFATIAALVGWPVDVPASSVSLLPYLADARTPPLRQWVHARRHMPNGVDGRTAYAFERGMVRDDRYKLIRRVGQGSSGAGGLLPDMEFFDLWEDPGETTSLTPGGLTAHLPADVLARLAALEALLDSLGGP